MLVGWWKARQARREAVEAEAERLVQEHGGLARFHALTPLIASTEPRDVSFRQAVLAAVEKLIGYRGRADTSTRMLYR
jgi:hypothetical protein